MLTNIIEAVLFAAGKGLEVHTLYNGLVGYTRKEIDAALEELKKRYSGDCGIRLIQYNKTYQFQSNPDYGETIADMLMETKERELSKTLLQVLAIIAYKQPVTRSEIEDLRGVGSDYVIAMLLKLNLIETVGRKETLGRPLLYGTTDEFLRKFGLESLEELPDYDDLMQKIRNNFDKYYAKTQSLYRDREIDTGAPSIGFDEDTATGERAKVAAADSEDDYYADEEESDNPDFLKGEDVVEVD